MPRHLANTYVEAPPWWSRDPLYCELATLLDAEWAIDNHAHLRISDTDEWPKSDPTTREAAYRTKEDQPFRLLVENGAILRALRTEYGVSSSGLDSACEEAIPLREERIGRRGLHGFWLDHLDRTRTHAVVVNKVKPDGADGNRLKWIAMGNMFLLPFPADSLLRDPTRAVKLRKIAAAALARIGAPTSPPPDLASYLGVVERVIADLKAQGSVGLKFTMGYWRTLRIESISAARASELYARAHRVPLTGAEYVELQDHFLFWIFVVAGRLGLPIQIHSSPCNPPSLQLQETDVRHLDGVFSNPAFSETQFVLVHGGYPLVREAAALSLNPNVWIDLSALGIRRPVPDLASIIREYLLATPGRVLFGTDAVNEEFVGSEVHHSAVSRATRDGLTLALVGLCHDSILGLDRALAIGRAVLRENAQRLYLNPSAVGHELKAP